MHSNGGTNHRTLCPADQRYSRPYIEDKKFEKARPGNLHVPLDEEKRIVPVPQKGSLKNKVLEDDTWTDICDDYRNERIASDDLFLEEQHSLQACKTTRSDLENMRTALQSSSGTFHTPEPVAIARSSSPNDELCETMSPCSMSVSESHEHLFYKIVTPSDVGKLNRLVIPKQHAERYFPLDPNYRKRGLLLSFRDDDIPTGKLWWFRYSYWSSSQSYVLTKGWIGFVKEKQLQAGDIISFERGMHDELYINCRRRPTRVCAQEKIPLISLSRHSTASGGSLPLPLSKEKHSDDQEMPETDPLNSISEMRLFGVDLRLKYPMSASKVDSGKST
ncbi:hypothetical protein O6H91_18G024800 [Diphasiastrum complanatum]|uniref:Uncharacterized protein n=1 Tax=Diphasiastrum complanatum TaxID=34168 RepID=A0ACC2AZ22_DIPCM|nr:hypothetical protein O6H91_18G024800 [Diphasiastrum complanatum]